MTVLTGGGQRHATGNQVPAPSHARRARLALRRLAGLLVRRLDQAPTVLPGDAGEGPPLRCPSPTGPCPTRTPEERSLNRETPPGGYPAARRERDRRGSGLDGVGALAVFALGGG